MKTFYLCDNLVVTGRQSEGNGDGFIIYLCIYLFILVEFRTFGIPIHRM